MSSARSSVTARLSAAVGLQTFSAPPPPPTPRCTRRTRPRPVARQGLAPSARRPEMAICGAPRASHFSLLGLLPGGCHGYLGRHVTMRSPWRPREEQAHGPYVDGAAFLRRDEFGPRTLSPLSGRWFAHLLLSPHPIEQPQVYAHGGVGG